MAQGKGHYLTDKKPLGRLEFRTKSRELIPQLSNTWLRKTWIKKCFYKTCLDPKILCCDPCLVPFGHFYFCHLECAPDLALS